MGNNSGKVREKPEHHVTLTKGFFIQTTEVTQGEWFDIMGEKPWSGVVGVKDGKDYPAAFISWNDVKTFITELNKKEGVNKYRLPTEAEWEYACRAGTTTKYHFGDDESHLDEFAWYYDNTYPILETYAHKTGTKKPNPWGLYNMHGNVSEWCEDWRGKNYSKDFVSDPKGPDSGWDKMTRGGNWSNSDGTCTSVYRNWYLPTVKLNSVGFRLVSSKK